MLLLKRKPIVSNEDTIEIKIPTPYPKSVSNSFKIAIYVNNGSNITEFTLYYSIK
jgi:hypothetical protein